ncbi:MarR family winged helix-turn-helix transcriptional regulator [Hyphococcus sp.]|uniref:MarR family winged helix-turn-helix transcriptional regulator n=1 Tax=Hyphococcus sp. TaxID=2038636 RepID=UPI003CCB9D92
MRKKTAPAGPGLPGDPALFKALTEIAIIANLAEHAFARTMPGKLTVAQFGVLNHLLRLGAMETVGELASAFQVAQPTMSSTVKKLLEKKYVDIVPDTEDRRVKRVRVTSKGKAMREAAVQAIAPQIASLKAALPGMDWEGLLSSLLRLRTCLDGARPNGPG